RRSGKLRKPVLVMAQKVPPPNYVPWFIFGISFIQAFVYYACDPDYLTEKFGYDPNRCHEFWRFLTLALVNRTEFHLWIKVMVQVIVGAHIENSHGWKIVPIYFVSVIAVSIFTSAVYEFIWPSV
ncbi:Rhomboid-related protein 2, partial [Pseudolycoriella hygida]